MSEWSLEVTIEVVRDGMYRESVAVLMPMRDLETSRCAEAKVFEAVHEALAFYSRIPTSAQQQTSEPRDG